MRLRKDLLIKSAMLVLLVGSFALPLLAQQGKLVPVGKQGRINFDSDVRAGEALLKKGYYQIQHVVEGADHVIVFTKLRHPPGGLGRGDWMPSKEVTRVKCKVEPLGEVAKHGGLRYGTNAAGEKTIEEVHIQGENVKHVF